ncbi:MAG: VWA domain-containing protein [Planctomycetia bacterium]|nr:VWA domain-containing protein [Planctomycetia bacterium]
MSTRRLPVYLLLDCSESMAGEAITQLQAGIASMVDHLQSDPYAIETAHISVITFSNDARQVVPLTEVLNFKVPKLAVRTGSELGAGLRVLMDCIRREVRKTTPSTKGDYKPIVILFSDGQPTDDWEPVAEEIRKQRSPGIANIYAIGCGPDADFATLREITDIVLKMPDMQPEMWKKVFVWLTASVSSTSQALEGGGEGRNLNLPELPAGALEIPPASTGPYLVRQVFLHARCQRDGKPYLMRFARRGRSDTFVALCSHPLDVVEKMRTGPTGQRISTDQLEGVPPCPYCENPVAVACECGTLACLDPRKGVAFACPTCGLRGSAGVGGGGFDVHQALG